MGHDAQILFGRYLTGGFEFHMHQDMPSRFERCAY
jgi:hypothetical protein